MKIKKILLSIFEFLINSRKNGTTTLLKKIASENDVWVLVPNEEMKKEFGANSITFDDVHKMAGIKNKPILVDNHTLLQLSELSLNEFEKLDSMIEKRNRLIQTIRDEIMLFERTNGKI